MNRVNQNAPLCKHHPNFHVLQKGRFYQLYRSLQPAQLHPKPNHPIYLSLRPLKKKNPQQWASVAPNTTRTPPESPGPEQNSPTSSTRPSTHNNSRKHRYHASVSPSTPPPPPNPASASAPKPPPTSQSPTAPAAASHPTIQSGAAAEPARPTCIRSASISGAGGRLSACLGVGVSIVWGLGWRRRRGGEEGGE
jgi:hypothetical protein